MKSRYLLPIALILAAPALAQSRSISASDKSQGAQAHPELMTQFGGAYSGPQADFVERVGKRVALQSGLSNSDRDFTVTLLNSPVENAFAIPGGYVYVTRQLLALMNSEAELASVLGHEVGHVAARHSNKRNTRSTIGGLLAAGIGAVTGSDLAGRLASGASQLYTLGFSRSQEYDADSLGVRYITGAGYDPYALSSMLTQLNAETTLDARISGRDANAVPSWMSTHPNGAERVARARKLAQDTRRAPSPAVQDVAFLRSLDGLRYDDDPGEGIVDGNTFRHPAMRLKFTVPQGYKIGNASDAVSVQGQGGQAQFRSGSSTNDLTSFVAQRFNDLGARIDQANVRPAQFGGRNAATATVTANANGQRVDATIVAYAFPGATYWFTLITPAGQGIGPFGSMLQSVATLTDAEAGAIKGKRIRIVQVKAGDTVDTLARQMAYPDYQRERFTTLNGIANNAVLRPGMLVKLVVTG